MFENLDDPKKQALLALAAGLFSPVRGKGWSGFGEALGQGINSGLLGLNTANRTQEAMRRGEMERKLEQARLEQIEQARKAQEYMGQGINKFMSPGVRPATPNDDNGNPMPSSPAGFDQPGFAQYLAQNPATAREALNFIPKPQQPQFKVVGNRLVKIDGDKASEAYSPPTEQKDWQNPEYQAWKLKERAAGRTNVTTNVMPPRETFKDSLGLKKDFDSQPEVKGFKEVQGAWDQISTALQKPSPANDMAAATKFMKMLDPGSVVRESELMMAMQASGALDRFANTADRILKGHKLTPQQRKDFYEAGEALYKASRDRFSQTVEQYEGIAKQYNLDAQFIQNARPRVKGGWSIKKVD